MSFGAKYQTIQTRGFYTIQTLYEAIKGKQFTAGVPSLTEHCGYWIITFPPLDQRNQVWITPGGYGECNVFYVQKQEMAGGENIVQNAVVNQLTFGIAGLKGKFGENARQCEWLVDMTAYELYMMGI